MDRLDLEPGHEVVARVVVSVNLHVLVVLSSRCLSYFFESCLVVYFELFFRSCLVVHYFASMYRILFAELCLNN